MVQEMERCGWSTLYAMATRMDWKTAPTMAGVLLLHIVTMTTTLLSLAPPT